MGVFVFFKKQWKGCRNVRIRKGQADWSWVRGRSEVGHNLTGNTHAAKLTICSVNKAFHSRSVWSLAGPAQEHTKKSQVHSQQCSLCSTDKELWHNTPQENAQRNQDKLPIWVFIICTLVQKYTEYFVITWWKVCRTVQDIKLMVSSILDTNPLPILFWIYASAQILSHKSNWLGWEKTA